MNDVLKIKISLTKKTPETEFMRLKKSPKRKQRNIFFFFRYRCLKKERKIG